MRIHLRGAAAWAVLLLVAAPGLVAAPAAAQVSLDELAQEGSEAATGPAALAEEELGGGLVLRVLALERVGSRAVKATLEVENRSGDEVDLSEVGVVRKIAPREYWSDYFVGHYALVDFENGKKYKPLADGEGSCVCSRGKIESLAPGRSRKLWVQFTPPPLEVEKASVEIPGAAMFDELPIAP